jgi:hypothetical protein
MSEGAKRPSESAGEGVAKWWPGVVRSSRSYNHDQRIESAGEGVAKWWPGVARLSRSYNHDQRIESAGEGVAKWWPGVTRSSRSYNQYGESRRKPRASARGGCQQRIESARKGVTQVSCARDDSVTAGHSFQPHPPQPIRSHMPRATRRTRPRDSRTLLSATPSPTDSLAYAEGYVTDTTPRQPGTPFSHTLPNRFARICRGVRDGHDPATAGHHFSHTLPNRFARSLRSLAHPSHALTRPPAATSRGARHRTTPHCTTPHCTASHRTTPHCTTPHCTASHRTALHRIVFAERSSPRARWSVVCRVA